MLLGKLSYSIPLSLSNKFHSCKFLFDLHLSFVMKPVLYLPYPTLRMTGAFFFTYINGFFMFFIFYFFIASTGWSILELLYYRFKLISTNNLCSKWVRKSASIVKGGRHTLVVFSGCTFCFLGLCVTGMFEQTKYKQKLEVFLNLLKFQFSFLLSDNKRVPGTPLYFCNNTSENHK